jgi:single-stranded-DNA-specific exonuclease
MTLPSRWQPPITTGLRTFAITGIRIVDQILARRGFESKEAAEEWLEPNLERLANEVVVPGLEDVVDRIQRAVEAGERIVIFGDYDVDGVTSTAILHSALSWALKDRAPVECRLPTRSDGYGLREAQVPAIVEGGPGLLITVDCGSNDLESIAAVRSAGMDVVVIDHHQISSVLPTEVPLANPQRDPASAIVQLTAAGLAWLVVHRLDQRGVTVSRNGDGAARYLELAALGTVGDVAQLTGINRALVRDGLEQLRQTKRPGLRALARLGRFDLKTLGAEDIPFKVTPRLNAPGRVSSPQIALDLLLTASFDRAEEYAHAVFQMDAERRDLSDQILIDALAAVGERCDDPVVFVSGDSWHSGMLGPVANKLAERYGRPAIVVGGDGEHLSGSGRSVPGWDIAAAFRDVSEHLVHHGGHAYAAGLTVSRDRLETFREAINTLAASGLVPGVARLEFEAEIGDDAVTFGLVREIERMAPFGNGNPRPVLLWRGVQLADLRMVGKDSATAQALLVRGGSSVGAVMFASSPGSAELRNGQTIDALITLGIDTWNGRQSVKGRILDYQPSV